MPESKVINGSAAFVPMPTPDQVVEQQEGDRLDPLPFQFNDIRALATKILKRAQEQGQQKIEAARKQVAQMEKAAQDKAYNEAFPKGEQEGYAKGEKEGMAAAEAKINAAIEREKEALRQNTDPVKDILKQITDIVNESRQQLMAQAEGDLLSLALDIAKRLVGRELAIDPEAIRPLAVECIGMVTDRSGITVRVNPEDYRVMNEIIPDLKAIFPDLSSVQIESDPSIERGGIVAATREAEVDMRLATRLAAFEEAILGFSGEQAIAPWNTMVQADLNANKTTRATKIRLTPPNPETQASGQSVPETIYYSAGTEFPKPAMPDAQPVQPEQDEQAQQTDAETLPPPGTPS